MSKSRQMLLALQAAVRLRCQSRDKCFLRYRPRSGKNMESNTRQHKIATNRVIYRAWLASLSGDNIDRFPFCPKDTEQVKRLCQSTERYNERQRRNLPHARNAAERHRYLK